MRWFFVDLYGKFAFLCFIVYTLIPSILRENNREVMRHGRLDEFQGGTKVSPSFENNPISLCNCQENTGYEIGSSMEV